MILALDENLRRSRNAILRSRCLRSCRTREAKHKPRTQQRCDPGIYGWCSSVAWSDCGLDGRRYRRELPRRTRSHSYLMGLGQNTRGSAFAFLDAKVIGEPIHSAPARKRQRLICTLLQLAAALVLDAIPFSRSSRHWNFRLRVGVALALKPPQTQMRKRQWQRQLIRDVKLLR
jgi:hypothetical protein